MKPATLGMINEYFDALLWVWSKSPSAKMALADPATAYQGLRNFIIDGTAVEVGDYLLLYSVGPTWYSPYNHLIEELTIRFKRTDRNPPEDVVAALDVIAAQLGCRGIAVGDTQIGLMTPKYLAAGYTPIGTHLFKEVTHGICSQTNRGSGAD